MRLYIFHGDNQVVLMQKVRELVSTFNSDAVSRFSLKKDSFGQILVALGTPSFFAENRLVVIEDGDEKKIDSTLLPTDDDLTIAFLFTKELSSGSALYQYGIKHKAQIVAISQPQDKQIFTFLDYLFEKDGRALGLVDRLVADYGGNYLVTMILFQLRRLVLPSSSGPGFLVKKIEAQQKRFGQEQLRMLYRATLETEFQIKTGKAEEQSALLLLMARILR